jgi:chemotaxis protein methyltransferase CheR
LQQAKKGVYTSDILINVDPVLIKKYFSKIGSDQFKANKKIRDLISFHVGDIVTFPVSYLDVIFCRNLLIYYSKNAQDLILKKFSNVLKENKFLVLGMDESMIGHKVSKSFLSLYPRERIYQKRSATDMLSSFILERK